jgi:alpha-L-arabinofuranosidase
MLQLPGMRKHSLMLFAVLVSAILSAAQSPMGAVVTVRADEPRGTISRNIYGQFTEHLGRLIYEGLWVGEDSKIPNTHGLRNDVVSALRELHVPVLRWPGGCFADEYHWRDGIGPRAQRPRRPNASWGGVDTNAFGTHEFMDLAETLGADVYINGNLGSGSPQEMMEWLEYMTSDSDSTLARLRKQNGREKPWKVQWFAVGNESWGCGGNMRPEFYADEYKRYATFLKDYSGNHVRKLAVGSHDNEYNWTEVLMAQAAKQMDGISLHYYTLPTGDWEHKGSATEFDEKQWDATLAHTLQIEDFINKHSAIMDRYDPEQRVGLMVDEWGTWFDPARGKDLGALYQQNTMRDAVVAAVNLNIFNNHSDRVKMANIAQMVNVLQSMVLTDHEKMVLTPTYYVFKMYRVHQDATLIPVELTTPKIQFESGEIPALNVSASRDKDGRLHLSIANLDPQKEHSLAVSLRGFNFQHASGEILTGAIQAKNTFENPAAVTPRPFNAIQIQGSEIKLTVPAASVTVVELR